MVRECIRAGIAGMRIDDQPIEGKRRTQSAGVEVVPLEQAIVRYRAAVDMKNELDPDFVVMAQCYARDAANGGLEDTLRGCGPIARRPASIGCSSNRRIRSRRSGGRARPCRWPVVVHEGKLPRYLSLDEHLELGVTIAWLPGFTHHVIWAALSDFMADFPARGVAAWEDFVASRKDQPYIVPELPPDGEGLDKQRALEERYLSPAALDKYRRSAGGDFPDRRSSHGTRRLQILRLPMRMSAHMSMCSSLI